MPDYPIVIDESAREALQQWLADRSYAQLLVFADTNTYRDCYPLLRDFLPAHRLHIVQAGERYKTLKSCEGLWESLTAARFDRESAVLNLGGGVVGDMGGFSAATYKRGIDFVQIPTTLLAQVDASVGGKTGVDFRGYKNHIGAFAQPAAVFIWPHFLETLPDRELRSGYAEILKHHLIADADAWQQYAAIPWREWPVADLIRRSIAIKSAIVADDFREKGKRAALNFGHTIGHAIESVMLKSERPLLHGEAVAIGIVAEAYVSFQENLLPEEQLRAIIENVGRIFSFEKLSEGRFPAIIAAMHQDKKHRGGAVRTVLLDGIGAYRLGHELSDAQALSALLFYAGLG